MIGSKIILHFKSDCLVTIWMLSSIKHKTITGFCSTRLPLAVRKMSEQIITRDAKTEKK